MIEKYVKNVRFCLICNDVSKVTSAIQSRCTMFRFGPLKLDAMRERLDHVIHAEGLNARVSQDARQAILDISKGDMRKVLTTLQSCVTTTAGTSLDGEAIYEAMALPSPKALAQILDALLNQDFDVALERTVPSPSLPRLSYTFVGLNLSFPKKAG